jgi:hypothetical protein
MSTRDAINGADESTVIARWNARRGGEGEGRGGAWRAESPRCRVGVDVKCGRRRWSRNESFD